MVRQEKGGFHQPPLGKILWKFLSCNASNAVDADICKKCSVAKVVDKAILELCSYPLTIQIVFLRIDSLRGGLMSLVGGGFPLVSPGEARHLS